MTAKRLKRPRDPVQLGKLVGDILIGQIEDRASAPEELAKNPAAVALGRKGGLKGGRRVGQSLRPNNDPKPRALLLKHAGVRKKPKPPLPLQIRQYPY